ncbi:MAG: carbonic anhydrase [Alphaproteobacteria bacterium]
MGKVLSEVLAANDKYAGDFGGKADLAMPPARQFAILTCMDARLDPAKFAGLAEGDAHVIRNAGGRASDDAIRSLIISYKLQGTREWFVIHHTDCGMATINDETMRGLLASEGDYINWLTISDRENSVTADVERIRSHPLVPGSIPIYGYNYDVKTGRLVEVPAATRAGQAS